MPPSSLFYEKRPDNPELWVYSKTLIYWLFLGYTPANFSNLMKKAGNTPEEMLSIWRQIQSICQETISKILAQKRRAEKAFFLLVRQKASYEGVVPYPAVRPPPDPPPWYLRVTICGPFVFMYVSLLSFFGLSLCWDSLSVPKGYPSSGGNYRFLEMSLVFISCLGMLSYQQRW